MMSGSSQPDETGVSILIPTHNRASVLRATLASMALVDVTGVDAHWVVIDNNSTDQTAAVVREFTERLPITYIHEARSGKNVALNRALDETPLRDIIVFADDDISPASEWIREISASARRWPSHDVFGGRIDPVWPEGGAPSFTAPDWIRGLLFSHHSPYPDERPYEEDALPFGPNMWVRRGVFQSGRRFNEKVGPRPRGRIMGSETSFLRDLRADGLRAIYVPNARVEHRLTPESSGMGAVHRRAFRWGRSLAHLIGPWRGELHRRARWRWYATAACRIGLSGSMYCRGWLRPAERRIDGIVRAVGMIGETWESQRVLQAARDGNAP